MKEILNEIGINIGLIVAGFSGSLVVARRRESWRHQIFTIASGTLCANYISPLLLDMLHITASQASYGMAFIVGLSGLKMAERLELYISGQLKTDKKNEGN